MTAPISTATTLPVNWRALCKALMDAIDAGIPAERIKQSPMAVLYDAAMAQPEPEGVGGAAGPSGYAYCYPTMNGKEVRFNHGQEVNGSRPLYAIPYWLGQPPTARPAIKPVPVAERPWERECGWLDLDGECWWCPPEGPVYWQMANPAMVYAGWLLPARAMPIPSTH